MKLGSKFLFVIKKCFISIALYFIVIRVPAQDTLKLNDIVIIGNRLQNYNTGHHVEKFDRSLIKNQEQYSLSDFLSRHSTVFVRNYGPGTLATTSTRGLGAAHTAVLWNGFNLQSPMNGQLDLALLPLSLIDNVELQKGGSGALFGSGAVGGIIHMNNIPAFKSGLKIRKRTTLGSFGDWQEGLNVSFGDEKYYGAVKVYYHQAENDFPYINIARYGQPEVRQINNAFEQYGVLAQNNFRVSGKDNVQLNFWYQNNIRQIPPPMTAGRSTENQDDEFYRLTSEYQHLSDNFEIFVRSAYFQNKLIYLNPNVGTESLSFSQSSINETEVKIFITKYFLLNTGFNFTHNNAVSGGYGNQVVKQNRLANFTSLKLLNKSETFSGTVNLRQELIDGKLVPLLPSIGMEYLVKESYTISGNLSRNFRIPTFNDLYWGGAGARGNPDLVEEQGWSSEVGFGYTTSGKVHRLSLNSKLFMSLIDNWINWEQHDGLWMPRNIMQVKAQGVESFVSFEVNVYDFQIKNSLNYSFTKSTLTKSGKKSNIGTQLMYVPFHTGTGRIDLTYKSLGFTYHQNYTGSRYTNTDNSLSLPYFVVANMFLYKSFRFSSLDFRLSGEVNNILNESYQVIPFQAMPGRNYQFTINLSFHKPI